MRALNNTGMTFGDLAMAFALVAAFTIPVSLIAFACYAVATKSIVIQKDLSESRAASTVSESYWGVTFKHDDHLWFRVFSSTTLHHPDCPCGGAK